MNKGERRLLEEIVFIQLNSSHELEWYDLSLLLKTETNYKQLQKLVKLGYAEIQQIGDSKSNLQFNDFQIKGRATEKGIRIANREYKNLQIQSKKAKNWAIYLWLGIGAFFIKQLIKEKDEEIKADAAFEKWKMQYDTLPDSMQGKSLKEIMLYKINRNAPDSSRTQINF